jgi:uncharacterized membrane protein YhaH (DUF805 family)
MAIDSESITHNKLSDISSSNSWRKDIDGLLMLAEQLKDKCDYANRRIEQYRLFQIVLIALSVTIIFYSLWLGNMISNDPEVKGVIGAVIISLFIYTGALEVLIRRMKQRMIPDMVALSDVIELLRETEGVIAQADNWSALDRAEFKIRLSRFGISNRNWKTQY